MWRMSAPRLRRCVATLWRKVCGVTRFLTPAWLRPAAHDLVERRAVEDPAARRDEEPLRGLRRVDAGPGSRGGEELRPAAREVALDRRGRGRRQRDVPVLAALAAHDAQRPLLGVDVEGRELYQLARADAGRVERLEDRAVAQPERRPRGRRLDDPPRLAAA